MKKNDIIAKLAQEKGMTKKVAGEMVDALIAVIKEGVKEDGEVDIHGFLKLTKEHKDATTASNPRTGEIVKVPEKNVPKCKFSVAFKRELNE